MRTETVTALPVAETIRAQLGGNRFAVMTGARDFVGGDSFLQFRLPRGTQHGINSVRVTLDESDTYTVVFYKINTRKCTFDVVAEQSHVYNDQLAPLFERVTGLAVSL